MEHKLKYIARQETPASLWHIEYGPNGLAYEAQFIRQDAELIASVHNETGLDSFEEVVTEIEKRGLSLAPAIGETATWVHRVKHGIIAVARGCKVIGYTSTRVRIQAGSDQHIVLPESLTPAGRPMTWHPRKVKA